MKLGPTLRLILAVVLLAAATGVVWWLLGYNLGKGMIGSQTFRRAYDLDDGSALRLFLMAFVVRLTVELGASGASRLVALSLIAVGATLLYPDKSVGTTVGVALLPFAAAGVAETGAGARQLIAALGAAIVVALPFAVEAHGSFKETATVTILRAVFFFGPLLVGWVYLDRYVTRRIA